MIGERLFSHQKMNQIPASYENNIEAYFLLIFYILSLTFLMLTAICFTYHEISILFQPIMSGGTFFIGFIIEYFAKLNAIILIIYS